MKVLITGKNGQLGSELQAICPDNVEALFTGSSELDISDSGAVEALLTEFKPDVVINPAAYTAVDNAETDQQTAFKVNAQGPKNLALACKKIGANLIHISTDFVFDGSQNTPYQPDSKTNPVSVYGASKLEGEKAVSEILGANATIIRTAWVYSRFGNNFVKTMIRLMQEKPQLGIVSDQIGTPTSAENLAKAIWALTPQLVNIESSKTNDESKAIIFHWSDLGTCSWYDFAVSIQELGLKYGLLEQEIPVAPIMASQYPTPAKRPSYSVLDTSALREQLDFSGIHWRKALDNVIASLTK
ncbi:dTDP-4-dehydrorhamnose reductase [Thalassotalea sp. PS06]|uniref:dTDP-4-dehydrorhamnose reductase n=1 Tax=Thalassotalea sp. PS06 TaxID=2594005 RepID=UPI0011637720|nr:dTDP-4-dehydrorhamnose reductase [Thalassotalea sp. PS06]QDP01946.1 dTDP-4-dehydrorhamnose reductase [Thalassotalea sp. PS06]